MPARYVVERGNWSEAAKLEPTSTRYPQTEAMTHFARALGAARSGDPASAQRDVERIAALGEQLKAAKSEYWANEVEVMRLASARLGLARARQGQRGAGPHAPGGRHRGPEREEHRHTGAASAARELLATCCSSSSVRASAEEYETSQLREPNRYRGLYGAGRPQCSPAPRQGATIFFQAD